MKLTNRLKNLILILAPAFLLGIVQAAPPDTGTLMVDTNGNIRAPASAKFWAANSNALNSTLSTDIPRLSASNQYLGAFVGNASGATNLNGANIRPGILYGAAGLPSVDFENRLLYDAGGNVTSVDWQNRTLLDHDQVLAVAWNNRTLNDPNGGLAINWSSRQLIDDSGNPAAKWKFRQLIDSSSGQSMDWDARMLYGAWTATDLSVTSLSTSGLTMPTNNPPTNTSNIRAWADITNASGGVFKIPLFQ